jgi:hypothetical protein
MALKPKISNSPGTKLIFKHPIIKGGNKIALEKRISHIEIGYSLQYEDI